MIRLFVLTFYFLLAAPIILSAAPSWAGGIAIVDFQRALTETKEGKEAQANLDRLYDTKKKEIERIRTGIEKSYQDYQGQKAILSNEARAVAEQKLMMQQQQFEQTYMQYQSEMQQSYTQMLQGLDQKMRTLTQKIAKEKGYDLVVDNAVVVYSGGITKDITDTLISRYNAQ